MTTLKSWLLGDLTAFREDRLKFFTKFREQGDMVKVRFGPVQKGYIMYHPNYIHEVLVTKHASFHKGRGLEKAKILIGDGLLTSEGQIHRKQRKLIQPHFTSQKLKVYAEQMVEDTTELIEEWRDGEERSISDDMMKLTLNVITKTMFGTHIQNRQEKIREAYERVIASTKALVRVPKMLPTSKNNEVKQSLKLLNDITFSIIDQRKKESENDRSDLLSVLLSAKDEEGQGMSDQELRDQVMTILLAGHETTAHTLSWTWYLLSQHPEVEEKFWAELETILEGRKPVYEDVRKLTYTTQIIQESMRLYPVAWIIVRKTVEEVEIANQRLFPGDIVFMSQYAVHRDPRYFENPEEFTPERFSGDFLKRIPQYAYFPFGGGPRVCIGNHFAMMEAVLILATIGQRYRLRMVDDTIPVPEPLLTMRPKDGINMKVEKRK